MNENALAHVALSSTLNKRELQVLAKSCQERTDNAGTTIFSQGDNGEGLYVTKSGKACITQAVDAAHAEIELMTLGPSNVLGEMALLDDSARSATATEDMMTLLLPVWSSIVSCALILTSHSGCLPCLATVV